MNQESEAAPSLIVEIKAADGTALGILTAAPKQFKTGSRGFHGQGKLEFGGKRYQTQVQLVEIGSKPASQESSEG